VRTGGSEEYISTVETQSGAGIATGGRWSTRREP
jgi:hypothetical protein